VLVVGKDCALAAHHAVQRLRDAHAKALHSASERPLVVRLDDEVKVVPLHRKVDQAEAEAIAAAREALRDPRKAATRSQIPDVRKDSPRNLHGMVGRERWPSTVRNLAQLLRLAFTAPTLSFPSAAPGRQMQLQLSRLAFRPAHPRPPTNLARGEILSRGSDTGWQGGLSSACCGGARVFEMHVRYRRELALEPRSRSRRHRVDRLHAAAKAPRRTRRRWGPGRTSGFHVVPASQLDSSAGAQRARA
jgi:hypothetical protein